MNIDLDRYHDEGVYVIRDAFDASYRANLVSAWQDFHQTLTRQGRRHSDNLLEVVEAVPAPLGELFRNPTLIEIGRRVYGNDLAIYLQRFLVKDASYRGSAWVHHDAPYSRGHFDKLALFVALGPHSDANGGLWFVKKSHKLGFLGPSGYTKDSIGAVDLARFEGLEAFCPELEPGDVVMCHYLTWHYSNAAKVPLDRPICQVIYQPANDGSGTGLVSGQWCTDVGVREDHEGNLYVAFYSPDREQPTRAPTPTAVRVAAAAARDERSRWLHTEISRECPQIDDPGLSDWQLSNLLRSWAYRHIRRANDPALMLTRVEDRDIFTADAVSTFKAFADNLGGVLGGGCCHALRVLYAHYGFESYTIDGGFADRQLTRLSCLVRIRYRKSDIWAVQDPNYDFALISSGGDPLDYFDLLALLKAGRHDDIRFLEGAAESYRYIIMDPRNTDILAREWTLIPTYPNCMPDAVLPNGWHLYRAYMSWHRYDALAESAREPLVAAGYPGNLLYYFALPLAVYPLDAPAAAQMLQQAKATLATPGGILPSAMSRRRS